MSGGAIVRLMAICARGFEGANGEELPPTELSISRSALMDAQYAAKVEYDRMRAELSAAQEMREVLRELEWTQHRCPLCDGWEQTPEDRERGTGGHSPDCRLARLIGEAR